MFTKFLSLVLLSSLSVPAFAAEPPRVVLAFDPNPYRLLSRPDDQPGVVRQSTALPAPVSGACACDNPHLSCTTSGANLSAAWTVAAPGDFPMTDGVVGTCTAGTTRVPVEARHELSVWHELWFAAADQAVVTYERGRPLRYGFAVSRPAGQLTLHGSPTSPVACELRGDGVTVSVRADGEVDGVYPCITGGERPLSVRLLGFSVTGTAAQVERAPR